MAWWRIELEVGLVIKRWRLRLLTADLQTKNFRKILAPLKLRPYGALQYYVYY